MSTNLFAVNFKTFLRFVGTNEDLIFLFFASCRSHTNTRGFQFEFMECANIFLVIRLICGSPGTDFSFLEIGVLMVKMLSYELF